VDGNNTFMVTNSVTSETQFVSMEVSLPLYQLFSYPRTKSFAQPHHTTDQVGLNSLSSIETIDSTPDPDHSSTSKHHR